MIDWNLISEFMKTFINNAKDCIEDKDFKIVTHYVDHGEYEISFEILCLLLIESNHYSVDFNFDKTKQIALMLRLDSESIYDEEFWSKFLNWGNAFSN